MAFVGRLANLHEAHAGVFEYLLHFVLVLVGHLDDDTRVFGKEYLDEVVFLNLVEADFHTSLHVREAHLEQGGDETAGRDVVSGQDEALVHQLLNGQEGVAEVFGVLHGRHVVAHLAQRLGEGRTAQLQVVEAEVDVVERRLVVVHQHGRNHLLHVAHLAAGRYDDRTRSDDLATVGVFLRHGEGVLARRYVDLQGTTEVAQCLDGRVEACILTLLRAAGPHPVGRERYAIEPFGQRCPYEVGQRLAHGEHGACGRIGQRGLRSMTQRSGDTCLAAVVEGHDAAIAQRQLELAHALLAGNLARHGAVHLVGQPVLAGHGFQLEHVGQVFMKLGQLVGRHFVVTLHGLVHHVCLG